MWLISDNLVKKTQEYSETRMPRGVNGFSLQANILQYVLRKVSTFRIGKANYVKANNGHDCQIDLQYR